MVSDSLISLIAIQVSGVFATLAAVKVGLIGLEQRVHRNETKIDSLPENYVPRNEVELALSSMRELLGSNHAMLKEHFGGGRSIHAAADGTVEVDAPYEKSLPVDGISEARLAEVHPDLARRVRAAMAELAAKGTFFRVAQGLRTYAEQDRLYAQGRTTGGHIVTNARGGYSNHNFGCAVDCFPFLAGRSGEINFDHSSPQFNAMVDALCAQGLVWGGAWRKPDPPHFQLPGIEVTPTVDDRDAFVRGGLPAVWSLLSTQLT